MFLAVSTNHLVLCVEDGEHFRAGQATRICYTDEVC
jgi:hypothetical protein